MQCIQCMQCKLYAATEKTGESWFASCCCVLWSVLCSACFSVLPQCCSVHEMQPFHSIDSVYCEVYCVYRLSILYTDCSVRYNACFSVYRLFFRIVGHIVEHSLQSTDSVYCILCCHSVDGMHAFQSRDSVYCILTAVSDRMHAFQSTDSVLG